MKKLILLLLSAILCLQLAACDILTGSEEQMKNEPPKISHLFSVADGSTLEMALTQGQSGNFSPAADQWSRQLDISDQSLYGDAISRLKTAKLITENGKLNPNEWIKPSVYLSYSDKGSIVGSTNQTTINATGTYTDGAYQANDSYGVRAVGIATEKGIDVYACIVDLAFRSTEGGTLSLCTGENGSTLEMILNAFSNEEADTTDYAFSSSTSIGGSLSVSISSNLRLVFFDTETHDILGVAKTRATLSGIKGSFSSSTSSSSSSSSSSVLGVDLGSITLVALDKDGNEIEGNLSLGELLPGETRRVSVLLYNDSTFIANAGSDKDKENDKDKDKDKDKEYEDKYENDDQYNTETKEEGTGESVENEYTDKSVYEVVTGSAKFDYEVNYNVSYVTTTIQSFNYSFNFIFTDK